MQQATVGDNLYVLVRMPKANFEEVTRAKLAKIDRLLGDALNIQPSDQTNIRLLRRAYKASVERQSLVLMAAGMAITLPPPPVERMRSPPNVAY